MLPRWTADGDRNQAAYNNRARAKRRSLVVEKKSGGGGDGEMESLVEQEVATASRAFPTLTTGIFTHAIHHATATSLVSGHLIACTFGYI